MTIKVKLFRTNLLKASFNTVAVNKYHLQLKSKTVLFIINLKLFVLLPQNFLKNET